MGEGAGDRLEEGWKRGKGGGGVGVVIPVSLISRALRNEATGFTQHIRKDVGLRHSTQTTMRHQHTNLLLSRRQFLAVKSKLRRDKLL